jgi:type I restriction-modification system DNA methylase subunit
MTRLTTEQYNTLLGVDDSYKAPERLMSILRNKTERESLFKQFLELFEGDVSYDWFTDYFQDEHADRKKQKQDFTPRSVNTLISHLIGDTSNGDGTFYEPCAGTGGMTIARWNDDRMQHSPFDFQPSWYVYTCEELSDRALPFLLFNVIIRGMNAIIIQCDVLSRKSYGAFFIQNERDDHMQFSSFNVLPYSGSVEKTLAVKFVDEEEHARYEALIESEGFPKHLTQNN